jgi:hypothetical protein
MYPWCRHDVQAALKTAVEKYIAREERQKKQLGSILPPASGLVEWKKGLESLVRENLIDCLLVLMSRVKRIPWRVGVKN